MSGNRNNRSRVVPETRWDWIGLARGVDADRASQALGLLCDGYWYPIYARLRSVGCYPAEAEDITQSFFEKLIKGKVFESADPSKGRLRALLFTSLDKFLISWRQRERALKRGGDDNREVSLSGTWAEGRYERELIDPGMSPEDAFNRRWWGLIIAQAMTETGQAYESCGKGKLFLALRPHLDGERIDGGVYDAISRELDVPVQNLRVVAMRMKRDVAQQVRKVLRRTVGSEAAVDEELRVFVSVPSSQSGPSIPGG